MALSQKFAPAKIARSTVHVGGTDFSSEVSVLKLSLSPWSHLICIHACTCIWKLVSLDFIHVASFTGISIFF